MDGAAQLSSDCSPEFGYGRDETQSTAGFAHFPLSKTSFGVRNRTVFQSIAAVRAFSEAVETQTVFGLKSDVRALTVIGKIEFSNPVVRE
jgi:hypothetical protein